MGPAVRGFVERELTGAAIAAVVAFRAEVVIAGVLGATGADGGGFFFADTTEKRHRLGHLFLRSVLAGRGRFAGQNGAAALGLVVDDQVLLFLLIGKFEEVILQFAQIFLIFGGYGLDEIGEGGVLVFAQTAE